MNKVNYFDIFYNGYGRHSAILRGENIRTSSVKLQQRCLASTKMLTAVRSVYLKVQVIKNARTLKELRVTIMICPALRTNYVNDGTR